MLSSGADTPRLGWHLAAVPRQPDDRADCGIDVALILDLSGSVEPSLPQLKEAADTFVDALQGTPSRMALFSFSTATPATGATQNYPALTSVSTTAQADTFKSRYAAWSAGGFTNWDRGLGAADAANSPINNFDLAVVITDGNPTAYNQPAQGLGNNRFRETENGIFSANGLKRVLTLRPRRPGCSRSAWVPGPRVRDRAEPAGDLRPDPYDGPTSRPPTTSRPRTTRRRRRPFATWPSATVRGRSPSPSRSSRTARRAPSTGGPRRGGMAVHQRQQHRRCDDSDPRPTTTADGTGTVNFPLTFTGGITQARSR